MIKELLKEECKTEIEFPYKLILYNDDYNSFEHVIYCLMKYLKWTHEQSEQTAHIVHFKGKYKLLSGDYDFLEPYKDALCDNHLDARIEQY